MKKLMMTVCLMLLSGAFVYSQTDQGTMYLGGSLNLGFGSTKNKAGSNSTDGPKTFNFGINPKCGYFIADNLMIGLGLGYNMQSVKTTDVINDEEKLTTTAFNVGPFIRYYMLPVKTMGFFVDGNVAMGFGKLKDEVTDGGTTTTDEIKMSAFVVGITPGVVIFIGEKVSLEATFGGLSFMSSTDKQTIGDTEYKSTTSNFALDINPANFGFGVAVHL